MDCITDRKTEEAGQRLRWVKTLWLLERTAVRLEALRQVRFRYYSGHVVIWLKSVAFCQAEPLQEVGCVFRIELPGVVRDLLEHKLAQRNFERPAESSTLFPKYLQVVRGGRWPYPRFTLRFEKIPCRFSVVENVPYV